MDNMATKAHINQKGSTQSKTLMANTEWLMCSADKYILSMKAEHISGASNVQVDWLVSASSALSGVVSEVQHARTRPLHPSREHTASKVLLAVSEPGSRRLQCSLPSLASGAALCVAANTTHSVVTTETVS